MEDTPASIGQMKFLALGDSYTIGEAVAPDSRWPVQLVKELRKHSVHFANPDIIATTGWRTDDLMKAISDRQPSGDYDMVSLLIGVNNLYQRKPVEQYAVDFEELVNTAIRLAEGNTKNVFVLSIPDYGFTPFGQAKQFEITRATDLFNSVNRGIALRHGIRYFDITEVSRDGLKNPELIAPDNLHPSELMYSKWVKIILDSNYLQFRNFFNG